MSPAESPLVARHRRYFRVARMLARRIASLPALIQVARLTLPVLHPARADRDDWRKAWQKAGTPADRLDADWREFLRDRAVATALLYRFADFPQALALQVHDPARAMDALRANGGLLLTYHHPFAYHVAAVIGNLGLTPHTLTLSPEESPLAVLYDDFAREWFEDSLRHFNGGRWHFVRSTEANNLKPMASAMRKKQVVYAALDFDNFYASERQIATQVLGASLAVPVALIELALRIGVPIAVCWLDLLPRATGMVLNLIPLSASTGIAATPADIVAEYMSHLQERLIAAPSFWDNWGLLA